MTRKGGQRRKCYPAPATLQWRSAQSLTHQPLPDRSGIPNDRTAFRERGIGQACRSGIGGPCAAIRCATLQPRDPPFHLQQLALRDCVHCDAWLMTDGRPMPTTPTASRRTRYRSPDPSLLSRISTQAPFTGTVTTPTLAAKEMETLIRWIEG
jgi:hypothetical protein